MTCILFQMTHILLPTGRSLKESKKFPIKYIFLHIKPNIKLARSLVSLLYFILISPILLCNKNTMYHPQNQNHRDQISKDKLPWKRITEESHTRLFPTFYSPAQKHQNKEEVPDSIRLLYRCRCSPYNEMGTMGGVGGLVFFFHFSKQMRQAIEAARQCKDEKFKRGQKGYYRS